jgi:peptidoglycan/LPS O-acetylase OafA/YrhL
MLAVLQDLRYLPELLNDVVTYGFIFYVGLVAAPVFQRLMPRMDGRRGVGLLLFGWLLTMFHGAEPRGIPLLLEVCGAAILVFGGVLMTTRNLWTRALDYPFWNRLGEISYSFYLYHMIVLYCIANVMFRQLDPNLISAYPLPFVMALIVLVFVPTAAIAMVSYRLIELPMIAYSKRRTPWRVRAPQAVKSVPSAA